MAGIVSIAGPGSRRHVTSISPSLVSYSTSFDLTENPISESSRWAVTDANATPCRTLNGYACGTQTGNNGYDDSQAVLSGFGANVEVVVTFFRHASISSTNHEAEICMHSTETGTTTKKYEMLINKDGGIGLAKWAGGRTFSDFQDLGVASGLGVLSGPPQTGDQARARITAINGTTIRLQLWHTPLATGVEYLVAQVDDNGSIGGAAYMTGQPGMGFYISDSGGNPIHYGFSSYLASEF